MDGKFGYRIIWMTLFFTIVLAEFENDTDILGINDAKILSRRKRFIVFPDGSSFQLVFCAQNQGYLQVGDIVWFGNTAALAWELPADPIFFQHFKQYEKDYKAQRRQDVSRNIYYLDENGKLIAKVPYHKKPIVNPAFAKRSIDDDNVKEKTTKKISANELHKIQNNINFFKDMDEHSVNFHRDGRKSFYAKLEKLFQGLGLQGKQCILQMLCESGRKRNEQGTFLEEIVRAVFTLPHGRGFDADEDKLYDIAHNSVDDCATLYPECKELQLAFVQQSKE